MAFLSLFLVIWFPSSSIIIIISAIMLGIAVSPIWVIMLSSVQEDKQRQTNGLCLFCLVLGLLVGWVVMNFLIKIHPLHYYL